MKSEANAINFNDIKKKVDYLLHRENVVRLINYLVHKLKFRSQTFYLATYLTDMVMMHLDNLGNIEDFSISAELVAVSCLVLTVKFDEIDAVAPDLNFFRTINYGSKSKFSCEPEEILHCELLSLKLLDYRLNYMTPYHFVNFLFANGIVFKDEVLKTNIEEDSSNEINVNVNKYEKIYESAKEALFLFVEGKLQVNLEEDYLYYTSVEIACACIALGRSLYLEIIWDQRLEKTYEISYEDFSDCFELINK